MDRQLDYCLRPPAACATAAVLLTRYSFFLSVSDIDTDKRKEKKRGGGQENKKIMAKLISDLRRCPL
jgi:hypothetical protein